MISKSGWVRNVDTYVKMCIHTCIWSAYKRCAHTLVTSSQIHSPWMGDIVDFGLLCRPAILCSLAGPGRDGSTTQSIVSPVRDSDFGYSILAEDSTVGQWWKERGLQGRVPDPEPEPDPNVCWPPGSGSVSLPSTSNKLKKNLDFYCCVTFYDFLSLKNDVNVYHQKGKSIKTLKKKKKLFFVGVLKVTNEQSRIRSRIR
jgi:hypothetical protein